MNTKNTVYYNQNFEKACETGDLENIRHYLTSGALNPKVDIHQGNDYGLHLACENGHLEVVKYLLASQELEDHADVRAMQGWALQLACENGHLEIVKYLLTSKDLKSNALVRENYDRPIKYAANRDMADVVRFLIEFPESPYRTDINTIKAVLVVAAKNGSQKTVAYLIHETDFFDAYTIKKMDFSKESKITKEDLMQMVNDRNTIKTIKAIADEAGVDKNKQAGRQTKKRGI